MDRAQPDLAAAGARLLLIGQASPRQAAHFRDRQHLTAPVLADAERVSYRAVGARRGSISELVSPHVLAKGVATFARTGKLQTRPVGDTSQLGAAAVIDRDGSFLLHHVSADPSDNVGPDELLAALNDR